MYVFLPRRQQRQRRCHARQTIRTRGTSPELVSPLQGRTVPIRRPQSDDWRVEIFFGPTAGPTFSQSRAANNTGTSFLLSLRSTSGRCIGIWYEHWSCHRKACVFSGQHYKGTLASVGYSRLSGRLWHEKTRRRAGYAGWAEVIGSEIIRGPLFGERPGMLSGHPLPRVRQTRERVLSMVDVSTIGPQRSRMEPWNRRRRARRCTAQAPAAFGL